ncbi:MAG: leucine-rich repeat domain-containing protein [Treponema sp.]|jgi:hypothetical protein|nr:leucine-rich repeat domain-containing protein [Treponema sp.]
MKRNALVLMLIIGFVFSVFGQNTSNFQYTENNGKITITEYHGSGKVVIIPETINGMPVVAMGDNAFRNNGLTSITLPNSLTVIGSSAFRDNALTSITLPNSLTTIGADAFRNNQLTSVTFPRSLTGIERGAFSNNQITGITFSSGITYIRGYSFRNNRLTNVVVPNSVSDLAEDAFDLDVEITRR